MKKLNRKGFTLVELLAVIIILAIVVGITIPAILTTTQNAKKKAFSTAAETCADWFERQYQLYLVDKTDAGINDNLKGENGFSKLGTGTPVVTQLSYDYSATDNNDLVTACGLKGNNVSNVKIKISSNGRVCALLTAAANGDYAKTGGYTSTGAEYKEDNKQVFNQDYAIGGNCNGVTFSQS